MHILVTGSAGFIGFHVCQKLLAEGHAVIGVDNFNPYYQTGLKEDRNNILERSTNFRLYRGDISHRELVGRVFQQEKIDKIIHLAAQAGVRYSIENPHAYIQSNIVGFVNVLDEARRAGIKDFIFASSGSVYGSADSYPTTEDFDISRPISLYAATKGCNELIAHDYHKTFNMNCIGLRFFTVYGPWGRPDMAIFLFTDGIARSRPIKVFNHGDMERDFTYIDDIAAGILAALNHESGYEIFNLGSGQSIRLEYYIDCIEKELGKKAIREYHPRQKGDVKKSSADIEKAKINLGYRPAVGIEEGIKKYVKWYREYYD